VRRRVAGFGLAAAVTAVGAFLAFQATIGNLLAHNHALDRCVLTPPGSTAARAREISMSERWRWWPPGNERRCVYRLKDGSTVSTPVPK
jgi:hypothetical protein